MPALASSLHLYFFAFLLAYLFLFKKTEERRIAIGLFNLVFLYSCCALPEDFVVLLGCLMGLWVLNFFSVAKAFYWAWIVGIISLFIWYKDTPVLNFVDSTTTLFQTALPVGFSFINFFGLSLCLSKIFNRPTRRLSFIEFFCVGSFFPSLMAGPFLRFPQSERFDQLKPEAQDIASGLFLILWGALKKAFADAIALSFLYPTNLFDLSTPVRTTFVLLLVPIRFYTDFSGISDMAVGMGRCLGIHLESNFRLPFLADSVSDYWKRWHISLGEWFREYFYNPMIFHFWPKILRWCPPVLFNSFVILSTMLLVGLWHGFAFHFIFWALYNGLLIILFPFLFSWLKSTSWIAKSIKIFVTFYSMALGQIFLVTTDPFEVLSRWLSLHVALFHPEKILFSRPIPFFVGGLILSHLIDYLVLTRLDEVARRRSWGYISSMACLIFLYLVYYQVPLPFIYSRF